MFPYRSKSSVTLYLLTLENQESISHRSLNLAPADIMVTELKSKFYLWFSLVFFSALWILPSLGYGRDLQYPIMEMISKSQVEVADILGQPDSCKDTSQGTTCKYKNKSVEVVFIDHRADWFAFGKIKNLPYDYHALNYIGLTPAPPLVQRAGQMHWQHYHGLELISVFGNETETQVIQVKAFTLD